LIRVFRTRLGVAYRRLQPHSAHHLGNRYHNYTVFVLLLMTMKNITITLDERAASWARKEAAREDQSLSRFIGDLLESTMRESRGYKRAMRQYLSREPVPLKRGRARYPSRDELHDRSRLR
jgi:hypothetical protein